MNKSVIYILTIIIIFSSCSNEKEKIENYTRCFFASLSDSIYGNPSDYYHDYDSLGTKVSSETLDLYENDIIRKDNLFEVHCMNNYTDPSGVFKQDSIVLFIKKNSKDEYCITDSRGLINVGDIYQWYGSATGAFKQGRLYTDKEIAKRKVVLDLMLLSDYYMWKFKLQDRVKILNWSWETSYNGEAHGEGRVVNNLDRPVSDIKYKITYFDYRGIFMAEDNGSINKTLAPGEKYNFSFWSSNAKNPSKARIELDFSDKIVYNLLKNQYFSGNEYEENMKKVDDSKENKSKAL